MGKGSDGSTERQADLLLLSDVRGQAPVPPQALSVSKTNPAVFKRPALEFLLFSLSFLMALLRHNSYDIKIPQIEMYDLVIF